jgi:hypothetical protein
MRKNIKLVGIVFALFTVMLFAGSVFANDYDCAAYDNYAGAEPAGYAENCMATTPNSVAQSPGPFDPTDMAFVHDNRNDIVAEHVLNDFPGQTMTCTPTNSSFAYDYNVALDTLYSVNSDTIEFGTFNSATCVFTAIGPVTGLVAGHSVTGITTDPTTGDVYATSTDITASSLYSVDTSTGAFTLIGTDSTAPGVIDLAMNCNGDIYANDIVNDGIYTIDVGTGAQTLVGLHGLATNFAQGMDFDNADGQLYIYAYTGGGTNTYGTVDLGTGAITPLSVDNPLGEYEGATRTSCAGGGDPSPSGKTYEVYTTLEGPADCWTFYEDGSFWSDSQGQLGQWVLKNANSTKARWVAQVGGSSGWRVGGVTNVAGNLKASGLITMASYSGTENESCGAP